MRKEPSFFVSEEGEVEDEVGQVEERASKRRKLEVSTQRSRHRMALQPFPYAQAWRRFSGACVAQFHVVCRQQPIPLFPLYSARSPREPARPLQSTLATLVVAEQMWITCGTKRCRHAACFTTASAPVSFLHFTCSTLRAFETAAARPSQDAPKLVIYKEGREGTLKLVDVQTLVRGATVTDRWPPGCTAPGRPAADKQLSAPPLHALAHLMTECDARAPLTDPPRSRE